MKNRVALAAMTNPQSHTDGTLGDDELNWLLGRARGGFAMITTCASHVAKEGQGFAHELAIWDDSFVPGLTKLASALHEHNTLAVVQIFHAGLRAPSEFVPQNRWSASATEDGVRAATQDDIERVIEQFAQAAKRAERCGFDGVEIHGAHGYLLTQFLSKVENRREDQWGGTIENRARLICEVTKAVRTAVSPGFVVGVRLSPEDIGNAKGLDLDESVQVAQWLCKEKIDFLHLSLWNAHKNTSKYPGKHALEVFRAAIPTDIPIFVAGNIWTQNEAQKMFELGADSVALGRAAICNPNWPNDVVKLGDSYQPDRPPMAPKQLAERGLSAAFIQYMRRWKGFVSEE